jgi:predicted ATP-grasp superfamily ATP-dependent carboligase
LARHEYTLVIAPEFDDHLGHISQAVLDHGGQLLGSAPDAIRLIADKWAMAKFWGVHGVAHPHTGVIDSAEPPRFAPPWVIKPRHGAGSQATFLVNKTAEWEPALHAARQEWPRGDLIWQTSIAGQAASIGLLIGPEQTIPLLPARQHLSQDGRLRYEGGSLPLAKPLFGRVIRAAREAVAGIKGLAGYIGVDLVLGDDGDCVIEINPRLTTSYLGLRQLCERNLAELMFRVVRGERIDEPTWKTGEVQFSV